MDKSWKTVVRYVTLFYKVSHPFMQYFLEGNHLRPIGLEVSIQQEYVSDIANTLQICRMIRDLAIETHKTMEEGAHAYNCVQQIIDHTYDVFLCCRRRQSNIRGRVTQ